MSDVNNSWGNVRLVVSDELLSWRRACGRELPVTLQWSDLTEKGECSHSDAFLSFLLLVHVESPTQLIWYGNDLPDIPISVCINMLGESKSSQVASEINNDRFSYNLLNIPMAKITNYSIVQKHQAQ